MSVESSGLRLSWESPLLLQPISWTYILCFLFSTNLLEFSLQQPYVISLMLALCRWSKLNMYSLICFLVFKNSGISSSALHVHSIPFLCSHWWYLRSFPSFGALGAYQLHYSVQPGSFHLEIENPLGANTVPEMEIQFQIWCSILRELCLLRLKMESSGGIQEIPGLSWSVGEFPLKERPVILDTEYRVNNGTNAWD